MVPEASILGTIVGRNSVVSRGSSSAVCTGGFSTMEVRVTVLLMEHDDGTWVAQGLEYDIAAQAQSLEEVRQAFERVFVGQMIVNAHYGKELLAGIPRAPKLYWDMAARAKRIAEREPVYLPPEIPPAHMIAAYADYKQLAR
jgi:hypothetical protein